MERLKKLLNSGKLTKKHINNKGYNKYLKLEGEVSIAIDEEKLNMIQNGMDWKAIFTNTDFGKETVTGVLPPTLANRKDFQNH